MIVADTNAIIWFLQGDQRLGPTSRKLIEDTDDVGMSVFSLWEIAMLHKSKRIDLRMSPAAFRLRALDLDFRELPLTAQIAVAAVMLADLHRDPADRIVVATALAHGATLVTADPRLLKWTGAMRRHDALL